MEAKLIKINDNQPDGGFYILRDLNGNPMALEGNLSLKNCQAIERGYDLDELAKEECEYNQDSLRQFDSKFIEFYKEGFQKALELMGDKKFSEEDMSKAWSEGYHRKVDEINGNELRYFDKFIQSLQQTEWDVEIVMEPCYYDNSLGGFSTSYKEGMPTEQPKLDADGCLILKRI